MKLQASSLQHSLAVNSRFNKAQLFINQFMECIRSITVTSCELYGTTLVYIIQRHNHLYNMLSIQTKIEVTQQNATRKGAGKPSASSVPNQGEYSRRSKQAPLTRAPDQKPKTKTKNMHVYILARLMRRSAVSRVG